MHSVAPLGSCTQLSVFHCTLFQAQSCPKFSVIQSLKTSSNTLLTTVPLNHLCPLTQSSFITYVHSRQNCGGGKHAPVECQISWVQIMNAIPSRCMHAQGQSISNLQGNQRPPASWCLARFERAFPHTSNKISDKSAALRNRQAVRSRAGGLRNSYRPASACANAKEDADTTANAQVTRQPTLCTLSLRLRANKPHAGVTAGDKAGLSAGSAARDTPLTAGPA